jgi:F1F0 ATPase subunit 2
MIVIDIVFSLAVGAVLGIVFYGGLLLTVRRLVATRHPGSLMLSSLLVRTAIVLAGLLLVARGRWENVLGCVVGFTIGRVAVSRIWLCT